MAAKFNGTWRASATTEMKPGLSRVLRLAISLSVVSAVLALEMVSHTPVARAYSCVTRHCYGGAIWPNSHVPGTTTSIYMAELYCDNCDGFIDDETWLSEDTSTRCEKSTLQACWVEIGYTKGNDTNYTQDYFWADVRPGQNYRFFDLGPVASCAFGNYTYFLIDTTGPDEWEAYFSDCNRSSDNYSYNNSLSPDTITIGSELAGTARASANRAYFIDNYWENSNHQWVNQSVDGDLYYNNPPYVGWSIPPSQSSTGGELWTNT